MSGGVCSILSSSTEGVELLPGPRPTAYPMGGTRQSCISNKRNVGRGAVAPETHGAPQGAPALAPTSGADRATRETYPVDNLAHRQVPAGHRTVFPGPEAQRHEPKALNRLLVSGRRSLALYGVGCRSATGVAKS
jgi:hypothetical protein